MIKRYDDAPCLCAEKILGILYPEYQSRGLLLAISDGLNQPATYEKAR